MHARTSRLASRVSVSEGLGFRWTAKRSARREEKGRTKKNLPKVSASRARQDAPGCVARFIDPPRNDIGSMISERWRQLLQDCRHQKPVDPRFTRRGRGRGRRRAAARRGAANGISNAGKSGKSRGKNWNWRCRATALGTGAMRWGDVTASAGNPDVSRMSGESGESGDSSQLMISNMELGRRLRERKEKGERYLLPFRAKCAGRKRRPVKRADEISMEPRLRDIRRRRHLVASTDTLRLYYYCLLPRCRTRWFIIDWLLSSADSPMLFASLFFCAIIARHI